MENLIITTDKKLEEVIHRVWDALETQKKETLNQKPLTINQVAKKTKRAYRTIKRLVEDGTIKSTSDKRIPFSEVDKLMKG